MHIHKNRAYGGLAIHAILTKHIRKAFYGILLAGMVFSTSGAGRPHAARSADAMTSTDSAPQTGPVAELTDFGVISSTDGWVLMGNRLYWTTDDGKDWKLITPALPDTATIYAASFLEPRVGWVLWSDGQADGSLVLQLERTSDQGLHWNNVVIQTLAPGDSAADVENASLDWLDEKAGWVSVKQKTGSNFSSGILFRTEDGGQTWQRLDVPIGEPVHFVNSQVGWLSGGPAGDQLFKTQDAGITWEEQPLPVDIAGFQSISLYPPVFDSPENGLLGLVTRNGDDSRLEFYSTADAGQNWRQVSSLPLGSQVGWLPLSLLDAQNGYAALPNGNRIIRMVDGKVQALTNQDGMSAAIVDLKMLTSSFGWAKWNTSICSKQAEQVGSLNISCSSTIKLIETRDGGSTWQALGLPGNVSGLLTQQYQASSTGLAQVGSASAAKTLTVMGQGIDVCEIPSLSQLQIWWNNSPYTSVNLYIGGSARACSNPALTAAYVSQMRAQGWTFIPTWVGPQAPCTTYSSKFNYTEAEQYGRDEAYKASAALAALGLTLTSNEWSGGSVVYYDMEHYGSDPACREAVKAFMNGWDSRMHTEFGNLAGVYASTLCNTGLVDYQAIPNIPDAIWLARWTYTTYDPNASVWGVGCIPDTAWNNHQRIHQYAGGHLETWGGATMPDIDSNVLDGVVAVPYFGTPSANFTASPLSGDPPLTVTFTIANTAFMSGCTWDYGDDQTGNSCAYMQTHIYVNPGPYTVSLTVSSPWGPDSLTRSNYINVNPGALDHFAISPITSPQAAGTAIPGITLTAQDINNNTLTSFTGRVDYSGTAGMTGRSTPFIAGQLTGVSVTPVVAGSGMTFIITRAGKTGISTFNVNPGELDHFAISPIASPQTAGTAIPGITLTAKDHYNNTVTGFTGTVTYGGTAGVTGASPAFSAGQLTGVNMTPIVAGTGKTFTVTRTGATETGTSNTFTVNPGPLDHFAISPISSPQAAGTPIPGITLTAQDIYNNTVTGFTGTVAYGGSTGVTGTSPAFNAGRLTNVTVTPKVAGTGKTFIVTESGGKTGTTMFDVNPGTLDHFAISTISSPQTAGTAITGITLTAQDLYNNTVTGFTSMVIYSGTAGITGTSGAFVAGQATFVSVMPTVAGTGRTFVVTGSGGKTGMATFDVNPGALDHFAISPIASPQMVGTAIPGITLTAQDLYNNTVTGFTGTVAYGGTAGVTGASSAFTAGRLTGVSVTPIMYGTGLTFIVTGSGKTGTRYFDVNPYYTYIPLVLH